MKLKEKTKNLNSLSKPYNTPNVYNIMTNFDIPSNFSRPPKF